MLTYADRFWGGEDAISKDVKGVDDFFRDGAPDTNIQDRDEKEKMKKWFAGGDQVWGMLTYADVC